MAARIGNLDWLVELPGQFGLHAAIGAAEDALARLDERLRGNPFRDGWIARANFGEACANLYLAGELVHLEDLMLHDAETDVRGAPHELVRAHAVLHERRRIAAAAPGDWLARRLDAPRRQESPDEPESSPCPNVVDDDPLAAEFAVIDAAIASSSRLLRDGVASSRSPASAPIPGRELVYSEDWDEGAALADWRAICSQTDELAPVLAAAVAYETWCEIQPLQREAWMGSLLVADLLRARGKAQAHLPSLDVGLIAIPRARRRHKARATRILAVLEAISASSRAGLAELDRLSTEANLLRRRVGRRRGNSKLPALAEMVLSRPLVTGALVAGELRVSKRAALGMISTLGLRELTGRKHFRAWSI
ncbi:DUF1612 domain-containing protein [Methylosinus sp. H3A]|uniref:RHE_PE00001 family protein n=1 Tax=Methylosinus sp. H3A TaxID=2785786 RepID=UPI0018C1F62B|nr:RHE_PE00001 family protein [Methylosinus sp. H3A]MBG0812353.1 DUF1612 domain-containing protein [Methylosinus sp. H3A]